MFRYKNCIDTVCIISRGGQRYRSSTTSSFSVRVLVKTIVCVVFEHRGIVHAHESNARSRIVYGPSPIASTRVYDPFRRDARFFDRTNPSWAPVTSVLAGVARAPADPRGPPPSTARAASRSTSQIFERSRSMRGFVRTRELHGTSGRLPRQTGGNGIITSHLDKHPAFVLYTTEAIVLRQPVVTCP